MKRILKGVFGVFKFKKPIESREAFEMQLFDKISLLASSSLQKQIPISDTHPLLHVASKLKEIIQDSPPEKVTKVIYMLIIKLKKLINLYLKLNRSLTTLTH